MPTKTKKSNKCSKCRRSTKPRSKFGRDLEKILGGMSIRSFAAALEMNYDTLHKYVTGNRPAPAWVSKAVLAFARELED